VVLFITRAAPNVDGRYNQKKNLRLAYVVLFFLSTKRRGPDCKWV